MAMVGTDLGAAIVAKITAIPGIKITDTAELTTFCDAIGEAIVTYIQATATVFPGTFSNGGGSLAGTGTVD
jgi:hypothetical protein